MFVFVCLCRNVKSSQEVVEFVKLRLDELAHTPTCGDLTRICESVSHLQLQLT